jgi:hypothetical protein
MMMIMSNLRRRFSLHTIEAQWAIANEFKGDEQLDASGHRFNVAKLLELSNLNATQENSGEEAVRALTNLKSCLDALQAVGIDESRVEPLYSVLDEQCEEGVRLRDDVVRHHEYALDIDKVAGNDSERVVGAFFAVPSVEDQVD